MAKYAISGVWKDSDGIITHYSFHTVNMTARNFGELSKKTKAEAIRLLELAENSAFTMTWDYRNSSWMEGENVTVVDSDASKYLRSNPDSKLTDNLNHLIKWNDVIV